MIKLNDILATRVDATKAAYLKKLYPNFNYDKEAKTAFIFKTIGNYTK